MCVRRALNLCSFLWCLCALHFMQMCITCASKNTKKAKQNKAKWEEKRKISATTSTTTVNGLGLWNRLKTLTNQNPILSLFLGFCLCVLILRGISIIALPFYCVSVAAHRQRVIYMIRSFIKICHFGCFGAAVAVTIHALFHFISFVCRLSSMWCSQQSTNPFMHAMHLQPKCCLV